MLESRHSRVILFNQKIFQKIKKTRLFIKGTSASFTPQPTFELWTALMIQLFHCFSGSSGSFHFSMISLSSPILKCTFTRMESAPLNGNILSSAKYTGR